MSDSLLAALRPARARLDLDRLAANYLAVTAAAGRPVMPVVKADAYGHGAARVSRHLVALGAPMLAVAYAEEGAVLRSAGIRAPMDPRRQQRRPRVPPAPPHAGPPRPHPLWRPAAAARARDRREAGDDRLGGHRAGQGSRGGDAGVLRRPLGRAPPLAHRHHPL